MRRGIFRRGSPYDEAGRWGSKDSEAGGGTNGGVRGSRSGSDSAGDGGRQQHRATASVSGAWDTGSSKYASSIADADARSSCSEFSELCLPDEHEHFLPTPAPGAGVGVDRYTRVDTRMDHVAENLSQQRRRLEDTLLRIEGDEYFAPGDNDGHTLAFMMHGDDGMPTAGRTTTGVAVIDLFAQVRTQGEVKGRGVEYVGVSGLGFLFGIFGYEFRVSGF